MHRSPVAAVDVLVIVDVYASLHLETERILHRSLQILFVFERRSLRQRTSDGKTPDLENGIA